MSGASYAFPKETAIMILYKNIKAIVRSPDGDTDFFDIVAGILQGDTLAPYLTRLRTTNVNWSNKENYFPQNNVRSRWYPAETITATDCADDPALLVNTPA